MATHEPPLYDTPEAFEEYCARLAARLAGRQQERMAFLRGCEARLLELRAAAELLEVADVRSELQEHLNTIRSELSDTEALPVAGESERAHSAGAPPRAAPAPKEPAPPWPALPPEESGPHDAPPPEPALAEAVSPPTSEPAALPPPDRADPKPKTARASKPFAPIGPAPVEPRLEQEGVLPDPPAPAADDADVLEAPVFSALEGSQLAGFPEPELPGDRAGASWGLSWIPHSARDSAAADATPPTRAATPFETPPKVPAAQSPVPETSPPDVTQVVAAPRAASPPSLRLANTGMMDWDLSHIRGAAQGSVSVDVPGAAPLRLEVQVGERRWEWMHQGGVAVIGRRDPHGPSAPDVDLWPDGGVSRGHAQIALRDGAYYLTDLGSTNGTQINGAGLVPRADVLLNDGDEILIGEESTLCVRI